LGDHRPERSDPVAGSALRNDVARGPDHVARRADVLHPVRRRLRVGVRGRRARRDRPRCGARSRPLTALASAPSFRYPAPVPWRRIAAPRTTSSSLSFASGRGRSPAGWTSSGGIFDLPALERRAAELSEQAAAPNFWNDTERAQAVGRETAAV